MTAIYSREFTIFIIFTVLSFYQGFSELIISGIQLQIFLFDWRYKMIQWVNVCSDTLNPNVVPLD